MSDVRYVAPHLLDGRSHVIVDGAPGRGTTFTLSHWPGTPTPPALRADLSAEIVRLALGHPDRLPGPVDHVSIDHYDVDGVVSLALLVLEGLEADHGPLLVEAARVGDFDVVTDRRATLIAFALNGLSVCAEGGAAVGPGPGDPLERCGTGAQEALDVLPALVDDPDGFERLWHHEWAAYETSVAALVDGWATIEEFPEVDLAVVRVDPAHHDAGRAAWDSAALHRAAVHSATACLRVATVAGDRMELRYRYETWVRLSRVRPRPRVDLERLARALTAAETHGGRWLFDGAGAITPALHLTGDRDSSTIDPTLFLALVSEELAELDDGPPAWDPYGPSPA